MISLDVQPIDISFVYKNAHGVYLIDYRAIDVKSSETITFLPETLPSIDDPTQWIQMTRGTMYEPVILAASKQHSERVLNLAAIEGSMDVVEKMPDIGFNVRYSTPTITSCTSP